MQSNQFSLPAFLKQLIAAFAAFSCLPIASANAAGFGSGEMASDWISILALSAIWFMWCSWWQVRLSRY